jgi:hypothetical protein
MTDYTKLSGAEFQREVGTDPEKWAEAFMQRAEAEGFVQRAEEDKNERVEYWRSIDDVAAWFRDAMDAARKAKPPPPTE